MIISAMVTQSAVRSIFNLVFALLCAGPLTVTFWRGTFNGITEVVFRGEDTLIKLVLKVRFGQICLQLRADVSQLLFYISQGSS